MNTEHDWLVWWHDEGSGMRPINGQDHESHVRDMTRIAWLNGAFEAANEIERLQIELDGARLAYRGACYDRDRMRAERDEARREVCDDAIRNGRVYRRVGSDTVRCQTPQEVAEMMGWDCFNEVTR